MHVNTRDKDEPENDFPNREGIGKETCPRRMGGPERDMGKGERQGVCEGRAGGSSRKTAACMPAHSEEMNVSLPAAFHQPAPYTEASVHSLVHSLMEPLPTL